MNSLLSLGIQFIHTLGSLYLLLVLLRFLLQLVRADFYNPVSQAINKATNPFLLPLRRIIPGFYGVDLASLVLALIVQWIIIQFTLLIGGAGFINPLYLLASGIISILSMLVNIYTWGMLIYIIASFIAPFSRNPTLLVLRQLITPALAPIRKFIPPLGPIDLSPLLLFFGLQVAVRLISSLSQVFSQILHIRLDMLILGF